MKSIFSIFIESTNSFDGQENGEQVILLIRRHPFVILIRLLFFIFIALIPILIGAIASPFLYSHNLLSLCFFFYSIYYLLIWSLLFYSFTMYTLDAWIITDRRIIDSTQHGFFNRTVSELRLSRIQDMSVQTQGVIQTLLHFGDLQIQTAGTEEKFKLFQIPNPERVKDTIAKMATKNT